MTFKPLFLQGLPIILVYRTEGDGIDDECS